MYSRIFKKRINKKTHTNKKRRQFSTHSSKSHHKNWIVLGATTLSVVALTSIYQNKKKNAHASEIQDHIHPPQYPWNHLKPWQSFDHASIRRGFHVYYTIGKSCHSMDFVHYRQLVGVALTEEEAKQLAAEVEYLDTPTDEGEEQKRPGALIDPLPSPYRNEQEARYMNNGALPPDLSLIVKARENNEDYVFALLTGYRDPPAGVTVAENMYFNPYFPGGQISMPPPLTEGAVEFDDGTEASISQMSKDVVTYLTWASNPELNDRHLMGLKAFATLVAFSVPLLYYKRYLFSTIKNRKVAFLRRTEQYKKKSRKNY